MKNLFVMALAMGLGTSAFALPSTSNPKVVAVAQTSIVNYGLIRIQGLGGSFGKELGQNQICGLAGQALTGFQVLTAEGATESDLADLLKGLLNSGLTLEQIRSQLNTDIEDCSK